MSRRLQRNAALALLLGAVGCSAPPAQSPSSEAPSVGQSTQATLPAAISAEEAKTFLAEHPEALLLDVRNPDEWEGELAAIEGAKLLPLPELSGRLGELEDWKTQPIVTVCRSGRRSEEARRILTRAGFENVSNLSGGMLAWKRAGY